MKLILLYFKIETSFVELFEHFFDMLVVYKHVVRVDKYVIKINHNTNIQKLENMSFMNHWKVVEILVRPKDSINYSKDL